MARFQKANGISPAAGFFGVITRTFVNEAGALASDDDGAIKTGWLIKEPSSPRVYYVAPNRELMWVVNEDSALKNFGEDWNKDIKEFDNIKELDLPFGDYMV